MHGETTGCAAERLTRLRRGSGRLRWQKSDKDRSGLARLRESNLKEVASQRKAESEASAKRSAAERRRELFQTGEAMLEGVSMALYKAIRSSASAAEATAPAAGWTIKLGDASLSFGSVFETSPRPWYREAPAFDVVAHAQISVNVPTLHNSGGRSHSLWYCDAREEGRFQWFETAFMVTPVFPQQSDHSVRSRWIRGKYPRKPFGGHGAAIQLARPFEPLQANSLDSFIDRWASWFADAVSGRLRYPSRMPERPTKNSWRR